MSQFRHTRGVQEMMLSIAAVGTALFVISSSVNAQQPPWEGCRAASKFEYNSAKKSTC